MNKKVWVLTFLLGSADIALAQTTATLPSTIGAARRINPGAGIERRVVIRAAVDASYDSNVFGISEARARNLNPNSGIESVDDFSVTPSLQLDILMPVGRNSVYARGLIGYDFHLRNSRLDRERISLDAGGTFQATSSCSLSPNISYGRSRSNAADVLVLDPATGLLAEQSRRNVEERTTIGGQAACGRASGLTGTLGYRHTTFRNSIDVFKFNDLNQDSVDGSIGFQRPSLGRIAVYGNYGEVEYLQRLDAIKSYGAGLQFERNIGSRASVRASLGYSWVEPEFGANSFSGSSYSVGLSLRPSDRLSVDVLASRSVDFASTFFASYTISEVYSLNGTYRLSPRLSFNFGSSYQTRDFELSTGIPAGGMGPQNFRVSSDKFIRAYGGVGFDVNRRLRLNALVSQQRRDSTSLIFNDSAFDFTNTTVSIGASLALGR